MNTDSPEAPRYRLRFLLQEFDLPFGDTVIGRGEDCHITIFDGSISRRHARIIVTEERAMIEDLGSRNGCRVNGSYIKCPTLISNGDRIRIGTQELVFSETRETSHIRNRQTGSICFCGACRAAYAKEMSACPHCGSTVRGQPPSGSTEFEEDETSPTRRRYASAPPAR